MRHNSRALVVALIVISLIKPQFGVLVLVPFAQRMWRPGLIAAGGMVASNVLAYLVWPRDFPLTIWQSIMGAAGFASRTPLGVYYPANISLAKSLRDIEYFFYWFLGNPDQQAWLDHYGSAIGTGIVVATIALLVVWGRNVPPIVSAILITAWAFLLPSVTYSYYLVFAIAVAAVLLRDPSRRFLSERWRGALDGVPRTRLQTAAVVAITVATTLSLTRVIVPLSLGVVLENYDQPLNLMLTSGGVIPLAWLVASVLALIAWRPSRLGGPGETRSLDALPATENGTEPAATHGRPTSPNPGVGSPSTIGRA